MNSKWHLTTSITKSLFRIAGCAFAIVLNESGALSALAYFFAFAEILGIAEELGDKRQ